jgi:hypothetical protein
MGIPPLVLVMVPFYYTPPGAWNAAAERETMVARLERPSRPARSGRRLVGGNASRSRSTWREAAVAPKPDI